MKYWLIFMIFNGDGEYINKIEIPTPSIQRCYIEAGKQTMYLINSGKITQSWCVTDDHHSGRKQDKNIPLD